ncbi:MAG: DUF4157 domain-containing protein [Bacteroidota bacterium]
MSDKVKTSKSGPQKAKANAHHSNKKGAALDAPQHQLSASEWTEDGLKIKEKESPVQKMAPGNEPPPNNNVPTVQKMSDVERVQFKRKPGVVQKMSDVERVQFKKKPGVIQKMSDVERVQFKRKPGVVQKMSDVERVQFKRKPGVVQKKSAKSLPVQMMLMGEDEKYEDATQLKKVESAPDPRTPALKPNKAPTDLEPPVQQKSKDQSGKEASLSDNSVTQKKSSSPNKTGLPDNVKSKMETSFKSDFSDVRIHTNSKSAGELNALAYTQGNEIHFAKGQYDPSTKIGQSLIGHELAHVEQQRKGKVKPTTFADGIPVNDNHNLEKEADVKGKRAAEFKAPTKKSTPKKSKPKSNKKKAKQKKAAAKKTKSNENAAFIKGNRANNIQKKENKQSASSNPIVQDLQVNPTSSLRDIIKTNSKHAPSAGALANMKVKDDFPLNSPAEFDVEMKTRKKRSKSGNENINDLSSIQRKGNKPLPGTEEKSDTLPVHSSASLGDIVTHFNQHGPTPMGVKEKADSGNQEPAPKFNLTLKEQKAPSSGAEDNEFSGIQRKANKGLTEKDPLAGLGGEKTMGLGGASAQQQESGLQGNQGGEQSKDEEANTLQSKAGKAVQMKRKRRRSRKRRRKRKPQNQSKPEPNPESQKEDSGGAKKQQSPPGDHQGKPKGGNESKAKQDAKKEQDKQKPEGGDKPQEDGGKEDKSSKPDPEAATPPNPFTAGDNASGGKNDKKSKDGDKKSEEEKKKEAAEAGAKAAEKEEAEGKKKDDEKKKREDEKAKKEEQKDKKNKGDGGDEGGDGGEGGDTGAEGGGEGGGEGGSEGDAGGTGDMPVAPPPPPVGGDGGPKIKPKGSKQVTTDYFSGSLTDVVKGADSVGPKLSQSLEKDQEKFNKDMPELEAVMDDKVVPEAKKEADPTVSPKKEFSPAPKPNSGKVHDKVPKFKAEGDQNPKIIEDETNSKLQGAKEKQTQKSKEMADEPGEELAQPQKIDEKVKTKVPIEKAAIETKGENKDVDHYINAEIPPEVRQAVDKELKPDMDKALAPTKDQVEAKLKERDESYNEKINEAKSKMDTESKIATDKQKAQVAKTRKEIGDKKQHSIAEGEKKMKDTTGQMSAKREASLRNIKNKVEAGEKKASRDLDKGDRKRDKLNKEKDRKVAAEKKKGEEKKRRARKKKGGKAIQRYSGQPVQRKKGKVVQGFFGAIFRAIKKAINAIVEAVKRAINAVIEAAKKAIKAALEAAKKLAEAAMKAVVSFVKDAINKFKELANKLISAVVDAINKLKDALVSFIKSAIAAIKSALEAIGKALLAALEAIGKALLSALKAVLKAIGEAIKFIMKALMAVLGPLLGGIIKKIFIAGCNLIGLPGEKLWSTLMRAKDAIWDIASDPITFFKNLCKSGVQGFKMFIKNIKKHIIKGLMTWLLGDVAEGVDPPSEFSLEALVNFVRQVFGIDNESIAARAEELLSGSIAGQVANAAGGGKATEGEDDYDEEPVQAKMKSTPMPVVQKQEAPAESGGGGQEAEAAQQQGGGQQGQGGGGLVGAVVAAFGEMIADPAKLWEAFKPHLGDIKAMIIGEVLKFVIIQVVTKATVKIIAMLVPGGGFLTAIKMIFDVLMFLIENLDAILDLANTILDAMGDIMSGNIAGAAAQIENVLAMTIPLIFKFLAKLIGIGGIPAKIQSIIEKIRTPMEKALDAVILSLAASGKNINQFTGGPKEEAYDEDEGDWDDEDEGDWDDEEGDWDEEDEGDWEEEGAVQTKRKRRRKKKRKRKPRGKRKRRRRRRRKGKGGRRGRGKKGGGKGKAKANKNTSPAHEPTKPKDTAAGGKAGKGGGKSQGGQDPKKAGEEASKDDKNKKGPGQEGQDQKGKGDDPNDPNKKKGQDDPNDPNKKGQDDPNDLNRTGQGDPNDPNNKQQGDPNDPNNKNQQDDDQGSKMDSFQQGMDAMNTGTGGGAGGGGGDMGGGGDNGGGGAGGGGDAGFTMDPAMANMFFEMFGYWPEGMAPESSGGGGGGSFSGGGGGGDDMGADEGGGGGGGTGGGNLSSGLSTSATRSNDQQQDNDNNNTGLKGDTNRQDTDNDPNKKTTDNNQDPNSKKGTTVDGKDANDPNAKKGTETDAQKGNQDQKKQQGQGNKQGQGGSKRRRRGRGKGNSTRPRGKRRGGGKRRSRRKGKRRTRQRKEIANNKTNLSVNANNGVFHASQADEATFVNQFKKGAFKGGSNAVNAAGPVTQFAGGAFSAMAKTMNTGALPGNLKSKKSNPMNSLYKGLGFGL